MSSSNSTYIDKDFEEKKRIFKDFKSYEIYFKKQGTLVDQIKREELIKKEFSRILNKKKLMIEENPQLLDEVINLVDNPHVLTCSFDKKFLSIPKEILILTMQSHQKYFPTFNNKGEITNEFLIVANKKDQKGLIKIGNERVVEARLSDAEFFWNKDKTQNLVKKVSKLKSMSFFKGLGTYFDKVQRMRKLGGMISDDLLISKYISDNGDGINDQFIILKIGNYSNSLLSIYTRSGVLVYSKSNYQNNWPADSTGKELPEGSYFYRLDLEQDGNIDYQGWLYLSR